MISRFPLKLLLSPHADAQLKQYQLCPACSHKAATDLVPLHPKVWVYMLRPPKADTNMASDLASNFLQLQFCAISGLMWATLFAQLLEWLTADQRFLASSESTLHRQIVSNASCKQASTSSLSHTVPTRSPTWVVAATKRRPNH